jgi:hypothetical protein
MGFFGVICGHLFMNVLHEVDKYCLDSLRGDETKPGFVVILTTTIEVQALFLHFD